MADDLDAELLALAGDDASDEETTPQTSKQKQESLPPSSSPRSPQPSSTMDRKGPGKSGRRGRQSRNDDEDGQLSATESHHSLHSASMSESDSASDASAAELAPLFPYDKLYYSAEEKERIMNLPEIEREGILSDRAQQVDRDNQDRALRRLLATRRRESARAERESKRKASSAGLDDGHRKSSRQKMTLGGRKVGETSGAMAAYKRQREQKGKRDELRRRDPVANDHKARTKTGGLSDDDVDGESEVGWDDRERSPSAPKDDPPADLRDIQRARVGRSNFAQVCFYPGFDGAIAGCYSRVNVGPNRDTGENEYRVCLIKRFTEGRPYAMEGANGRSFATTQYAVLAHGKSEREFPFIACSDSPFTEAEFNRYRQTLAAEDCTMATKPMLARKVTDINRLLNHKFTNEELNEKLRKQGTFDTKMLIFKRMETERKLQFARSYGDEEEIAALEAQMKEYSVPKLAFGTTLCKPRSEKKTEQERIAELNLRNQKLNYENVRRAQLEERKAARKAAAAVARGDMTADPFKRVRTQVRTFYDPTASQGSETPGASEPSRDVTPTTGANSEAKPSAETPKATTPSNSQKSSNGGAGRIRYRNNDDENIAALDIELDIEI